jgi:hypothetical protein
MIEEFRTDPDLINEQATPQVDWHGKMALDLTSIAAIKPWGSAAIGMYCLVWRHHDPNGFVVDATYDYLLARWKAATCAP